ncbi:hypothetical protein SETIT_3G196700v2 [Setaria italica]|uniref:Uncharacterized protein n=1 Tax=Setaria italica TaxID=4555 RepID=K3ZA61_SETIT|nr:uncharacterized protein LOC101779699 [Setaria italica]RCV17154.1 hypothetical protein SETIT_3G196700v2 [Setaria italica]
MAAAAVAVSTSPCSGSGHLGLLQASQAHHLRRTLLGGRMAGRCGRSRLAVLAAAGKPPGEAEEQVPAWAKPGADEPPPWEREGGAVQGQEAGQVPFYAYLLASAVTAIAAIGSIFEYTNQRPVFGIVGSDSALYAPLLGFFVFTGIPTSAFLWFKAVQTANRDAEEQDRRDGFL